MRALAATLTMGLAGVLAGVLALGNGACGRCGGGEDAEPADAAAGDAAAGEQAGPKIGIILVADMTPPERRPMELGLEADPIVRRALLADGRFQGTDSEDPEGCKASFDLAYATLVNGKPETDAEAGIAHLLLEGSVYCPYEGEVETFRAEMGDEEPFGPDEGITGEQVLRNMLTNVSDRAAGAIHGQVIMRHARDAEVLEALASSKDHGILMEAAGEAGERKLKEAVPALARLAGHEEELVSLRAGAALGLIGARDEEALRALAKMTDGPASEKHLVAINALGDIGGEAAARYLDAIAIGHPDPELRDLAREALRRAKGLPPAPEGGTPEGGEGPGAR